MAMENTGMIGQSNSNILCDFIFYMGVFVK